MSNETQIFNASDITVNPYIPASGQFGHVYTIQEQLASLSYQYMRMMLIMSFILFCYIVFNFMFREDNELTMRIGRALDAGAVAASLFIFLISLIYFTGWM